MRKFYSLFIFLPLFISLMLRDCNNNGNSGNTGSSPTTTTSNCTVPLIMSFKSIKITDKKDKLFAGKDDVSFGAILYPDGECSGTSLGREAFIKVKKSEIGTTLFTSEGITYDPVFLCPNTTIAMVIYELDNNPQRNWNYACSNNIYYMSKNEPYGTIYIRYSDFSNTGPSEKTYPLTYGEVTIQSRLY